MFSRDSDLIGWCDSVLYRNHTGQFLIYPIFMSDCYGRLITNRKNKINDY